MIGKGQLNFTSLLALDDVLLVEGIIADVISISQLCNQCMIVNFSGNSCYVVNKDKSVTMKGIITLDNCFLWNAPSSSPSTACLVRKEDVT